MTVTELYVLLLIGIVVLLGVLLIVIVMTAKAIAPVKFNEGYNQCKALMSSEQARLEVENASLRRKVYQLEGNPTRVYGLLSDGRPQIPAGYHLEKDRVRKAS